jgi:hypothetical protein
MEFWDACVFDVRGVFRVWMTLCVSVPHGSHFGVLCCKIGNPSLTVLPWCFQ